MRAKVAKKIRKLAYGNDFSHRHREYFIDRKTGVITADDKRQRYQFLKRIHRGGEWR